MQIELSHVDELKDELALVKSSMEKVGGSRAANPEYVNKLVVELNAANQKIQQLQGTNSTERDNLSDGVISLEDELLQQRMNSRLLEKSLPL